MPVVNGKVLADAAQTGGATGKLLMECVVGVAETTAERLGLEAKREYWYGHDKHYDVDRGDGVISVWKDVVMDAENMTYAMLEEEEILEAFPDLDHAAIDLGDEVNYSEQMRSNHRICSE